MFGCNWCCRCHSDTFNELGGTWPRHQRFYIHQMWILCISSIRKEIRMNVNYTLCLLVCVRVCVSGEMFRCTILSEAVGCRTFSSWPFPSWDKVASQILPPKWARKVMRYRDQIPRNHERIGHEALARLWRKRALNNYLMGICKCFSNCGSVNHRRTNNYGARTIAKKLNCTSRVVMWVC